jgi:hypothetical protein
MKSYKWDCAACKCPNVFVHDDSKEGGVALTCCQCGQPGKFEPSKEPVVLMQPAYPAISTDCTYISSTTAFPGNYAPRTLFTPEEYDRHYG